MREKISGNDMATLRGIVRGPGMYATPSPDRIARLLERGLIKRQRGSLRPTLKGYVVAFFSRRGRSSDAGRG